MVKKKNETKKKNDARREAGFVIIFIAILISQNKSVSVLIAFSSSGKTSLKNGYFP